MKRILPEWVFDVIGWMIYGGLMTIYLPMYALGYLTIRKNIAKLKLLKFLGFKSNKAKLGLVSRRSRVTDISEVSAEEEIDFQSHRSLGYVHRMTLWTPKEIVKAILGRQKLNLISDEQLAYVILATTFSHAVKWDEKRKMFCLSMLELQNYFLFQGFYWDARQIFVDADGSRIIIQMDDGSEFSSDCEPAQRSDYKLAKLHAQVCLSYFAPGLSHNYVHFVFPSAVCVLAKNKLNHQSTLYKLLSPHFRFTERINYQALKVGKATSNRQTLIDRFFFFWQPFPITREQFVENVAVKCKNYYHECGSPDYRTELRTRSATRLPSVVEEDNTERNHFLFPPAYVTKKDMQKLPYMAFLAEYYFVVRRFVKAMEPFIDKSEWKMLAEEISVHVPRFNQVNMVDAIATFIHQVHK
ncbi:unnamed protein product [Clavelina lepadiformis]|uniref:Uncharacterized protein n=1 Tax=Clavelina lepadiformis TaxID=159417 RepID=A0ABP0F0Q1_CLALP